ncbi:hypothetical protein PHMEG_00010550 [Phytophthora megakarya]|uniref:Tc1-like transposase DDE domain-containing protein n=1 Tax=Phytophthora megakarya TaxID=4795 RepID=A0A225WES1_9STRA|nr:hypothetical protein PHMEG_00010550 [Phytophthora megakarya]
MPVKYVRYALETKLLAMTVTGKAWPLSLESSLVRPDTGYAVASKKTNRSKYDGVAALLFEMLHGDLDMTLRELADTLEGHSGVRVSVQTITSMPHASHTQRIPVHEAAGKTILYMDETNFKLWAICTCGRSLKRKRAVKKVFSGGGQNVHVIACMSAHRLIYFETHFGPNRYANMNELIRKLLCHVYLGRELTLSNVMLVLDNALVFEEQEFEQATLLPLGPYSPMLNTIEDVFSSFKS